MSWILRQRVHSCTLPRLGRHERYMPGDIWKCDDPQCGKLWEYFDNWAGDGWSPR